MHIVVILILFALMIGRGKSVYSQHKNKPTALDYELSRILDRRRMGARR